MKNLDYRCSRQNGFYINRDSITMAYFEEVRKYPVLSVNEEKKLFQQMKHGNTEAEREKAKEKLILSNLRFVISLAKKFTSSERFLDLVNEGNIGLIKAIEKFDTNKEVKLISYAVSWIIAYMQRYLIKCERAIIPPNATKLYYYVKNVTKKFISENERKPTPQETADLLREKFNFSVVNLEDVELPHIISINEKYGSAGEDDDTFETSDMFVSKTSSNNIQEEIDKGYTHYKLDFFLDKLNDREKEVITRSYGIGCIAEGFETIANSMNICSERVRQISVQAVKKMQKYKNSFVKERA